jgi:hypothetical protein
MVTTRLFAVLLLGVAASLRLKLLPNMPFVRVGLLIDGRGCCDLNAELRVGNLTLLPMSCVAIVS